MLPRFRLIQISFYFHHVWERVIEIKSSSIVRTTCPTQNLFCGIPPRLGSYQWTLGSISVMLSMGNYCTDSLTDYSNSLISQLLVVDLTGNISWNLCKERLTWLQTELHFCLLFQTPTPCTPSTPLPVCPAPTPRLQCILHILCVINWYRSMGLVHVRHCSSVCNLSLDIPSKQLF